MKNKNELKLYLLSQTASLQGWNSLLGDKYLHALPFNWSMTEDPGQADVIVWDGLMNVKMSHYVKEIISSLQSGSSILLLQHEAFTLFQDHPYLTHVDLAQIQYVELSGGTVLPENMLEALEICYKKFNHV